MIVLARKTALKEAKISQKTCYNMWSSMSACLVIQRKALITRIPLRSRRLKTKIRWFTNISRRKKRESRLFKIRLRSKGKSTSQRSSFIDSTLKNWRKKRVIIRKTPGKWTKSGNLFFPKEKIILNLILSQLTLVDQFVN